MHSDGIYKVLAKLDIATTREDPEWIMAYCPLAPWRHDKATDSGTNFGVHIEDDGVSRYNCLSCKSKGTLSGLAFLLATLRDDPELREVAKHIEQEEILGGDLDFGEWEAAPKKADKKAITEVTNFPDERGFTKQYRSFLAFPEAIRYLARRGISVNTAWSLGLRYDPRQFRILFPVIDQLTGRFAGGTGRSIRSAEWRQRQEDRTGIPNPKVRDYKGLEKDRVLLGSVGHYERRGRAIAKWRLRVGAAFGPIYIVEGLFAYARLRQLRPELDTLGLLGSALTYGKEQILRTLDRPIFWLTDNDLAGMTCLHGRYDKETGKHNPDNVIGDYGALDKLYGHVAQFTVNWPEDKNDPDDLTLDESDYMVDNADLYIR